MSAGGFLSAVGDAFAGYGQDKKNRADQSLRDMQTQKLQRENDDDVLLRSPEFGQAYARAYTSGDPTAFGNVVRMVAGHPQSVEIIKSLTREPKPDATTYDESRGVIINRATGSFTAPKGLPPKQYKPTETDGLAAIIRQQRLDVARAKHDATLAAAENAFNTAPEVGDRAALARRNSLVTTFNRLRKDNPHADPKELMATAFSSLNVGNTAAGLDARTNISEENAAETAALQSLMPKIGGAPSTTPAARITSTQRSAPSYSSDANTAAAQRLWDSNPRIQKVRARPQ